MSVRPSLCAAGDIASFVIIFIISFKYYFTLLQGLAKLSQRNRFKREYLKTVATFKIEIYSKLPVLLQTNMQVVMNYLGHAVEISEKINQVKTILTAVQKLNFIKLGNRI